MAESIIKALEDIGYPPPLDVASVETALKDGPKSVLYTEIVAFLTNELKVLCKIDEQVNKITAPEDSVSFLMELSSFLKELRCPHTNLTQGHMSDRLADITATTLLLDYLITELMASRILYDAKPDTNRIELKVQETSQAANMKKILTVLRFQKPPANISMQTLFSKLLLTVESTIKKAGNDIIGIPIFNLSLTDKQWHILKQVLDDLHAEYTIRREMLLKRLDCTIQSFQWSDKMKGKEELISKVYTEKRKTLRVEPNVNMSDLISAREDLAIIEKTSSASVRRNTQSAINRVLIGNVPDRGGRTNELAPPPPEMPSWQQRSAGPPHGGGRGRGQGFGRGGGQGSGRGRGEYSRGGGMQSSNTNDYNRGGHSDYNRGGRNDFNKGGGEYSRGGGNNYSRGGGRDDYNRNKGSGIDYNRSIGYSNEGDRSDYSRGGGGYDRGGSSYSSDYNRSGSSNFNRGSQNDLSASSSYGGDSSYRQKTSNYVGFDSAGSYGGSQDYPSKEPKRAKTCDYFQNQKTTYADQYVQESQHNQQYQPRRGGRGGYNRGGRGRY